MIRTLLAVLLFFCFCMLKAQVSNVQEKPNTSFKQMNYAGEEVHVRTEASSDYEILEEQFADAPEDAIIKLVSMPKKTTPKKKTKKNVFEGAETLDTPVPEEIPKTSKPIIAEPKTSYPVSNKDNEAIVVQQKSAAPKTETVQKNSSGSNKQTSSSIQRTRFSSKSKMTLKDWFRIHIKDRFKSKKAKTKCFKFN